MMQTCVDCEETKPIDLFVKDSSKKTGYRKRCKDCENLKRRKTPIRPEPKEGYKYCAKCNVEKPLTDFNVRKIWGVYRPFSYCKPCEHKMDKERYSHQCRECGKVYKSGRKNSKMCRECHIEHVLLKNSPIIRGEIDFSGENNPMFGKQRFGASNPNYNPDLTEKERTDYRLLEGYGLWRTKVYDRDGYTCQCCGSTKGGTLHAHHLDGYSWCKEKRLDPDNGVTLCKTCHQKFHRLYGIKKNTKQQFITYKNNREYL